MSVLERLRGGDIGEMKVPPSVDSRLRRGRQDMLKDAAKRRLCQKFEKGESYFYLNDKGQLGAQSTANFSAPGQGKPAHRIRNAYNFIRPIVQGKVSAATQRIPGYESLPTSTDPQRIYAARLTEKVALYLFDKVHIRSVRVRGAAMAIGGGGEAFALPYFDPNIGPYLTPPPDPLTGLPSGEPIGQGEIKVAVLSGNEVYWEPGVEFEDSRWHAVERAMPLDEIRDLPGFTGVELTADASTSDIPTDKPAGNLAMVTEYYERPSIKHPDGRRIVLCNGSPIIDYRRIDPDSLDWWEPYPLRNQAGEAVDEPVPVRLHWTVNTDGSRDLGLTWQLIDAQRTIQDCWNKLLEIKNRALLLRMTAPRGSNLSPRTDEPGTVVYYDVQFNGQVKPEWEDASNAIAMARPLFDMLTKMQADMRELGFDTQLSADANVAARTVGAVIQEYQAKWQSFLGNLADWDSQIMRRCLLLVQRHYSEARILTLRGKFGPETIQDFTGAKIMDQVDVRVSPGSLEYLSRDQVTQRVFAYADRGWITPQQAMIAIDSGTSDVLIQSLTLEIARVDRIVQSIMDGSVLNMPPRSEQVPMLDQAGNRVFVEGDMPGYMPMRDVDDLNIWKQRIGDFVKTDTWSELPRELQEVTKQILSGIDNLQMEQAQRQMEQQNAMAEQLGMQNASRPQQAKPLPDQTQPAGEQPTAGDLPRLPG